MLIRSDLHHPLAVIERRIHLQRHDIVVVVSFVGVRRDGHLLGAHLERLGPKRRG
jgi:hypothetical protein